MKSLNPTNAASVLKAILQVNLSRKVSLDFFLHIFWNRTCRDKRHRALLFLLSVMVVLSLESQVHGLAPKCSLHITNSDSLKASEFKHTDSDGFK